MGVGCQCWLCKTWELEARVKEGEADHKAIEDSLRRTIGRAKEAGNRSRWLADVRGRMIESLCRECGVLRGQLIREKMLAGALKTDNSNLRPAAKKRERASDDEKLRRALAWFTRNIQFAPDQEIVFMAPRDIFFSLKESTNEED